MSEKISEKSNKPIRVLQVIGSMNRGGAEAIIMNLYRAVDREQVQFDFVEHTDKPAAYDEEILSMGGKIYNCPAYSAKNMKEYKQWWHDFFKEHPEYKIVHCHIGRSAPTVLKIAKKYEKTTIVHSHSEDPNKILRFLYKIYSYFYNVLLIEDI